MKLPIFDYFQPTEQLQGSIYYIYNLIPVILRLMDRRLMHRYHVWIMPVLVVG